jgi:hypothetical protein
MMQKSKVWLVGAAGFEPATWSTADAKPQGELNSSFREQLRRVGWNLIITGTLNRAQKSDRLLNFKSVLLEPVLLPYCAPVAPRYVDPILGRIVGHCDA